MNQHNFFIKLLDTGLPATLTVFLSSVHRQPRPLFFATRYLRRLTSGHLSAAAVSKTSPMNLVTCIVLHLENIASLGWILHCKFRPLNWWFPVFGPVWVCVAVHSTRLFYEQKLLIIILWISTTFSINYWTWDYLQPYLSSSAPSIGSPAPFFYDRIRRLTSGYLSAVLTQKLHLWTP